MKNLFNTIVNALKTVPKKLKNFFQALTARPTKVAQRFLEKRPFISFLLFLCILMGLVVLGNNLRKPVAPAVSPQPEALAVQLYHLGDTPNVQVQAKIEKSGVVQLVAQTAGVVQKIRVKEGDHVKRGQSLFSLSTNYQGGSVPGLARKLSQENYQFLVDNYDAQKDVIQKNRDIANTVDAQASQLRSMTQQSLSETSSLIDLDNDIISGLDKQIQALVDTNVGGVNDAAISQLKEAKAGTLTSLNAARVALRNNQYQSDSSKEPAALADMTRDLALKQLDLQEKTLDLNKDISLLNLRISQVNESLMYPAAPCPGTVERIFVKVGQNVTPGTVLASVRGDMNEATAVAFVSQDIAREVSRFTPSTLVIGSRKVSVVPRSISHEPTDGVLHSVLYSVPDEYANQLTNASYIVVEIPVGMNYAKTEKPFVPLDSIYQSPDAASVFVVKDDGQGNQVATSQSIKLGAVSGQYVEVVDGLQPGEVIILNRNVIEGQRVKGE
jgi:multidrug efflux pump subunit AcrA (membrane-fusion protein)